MIRLSLLAMRSKDYCSTTDTLAHLNPLLFNSQDPGKGNSLDIHHDKWINDIHDKERR